MRNTKVLLLGFLTVLLFAIIRQSLDTAKTPANQGSPPQSAIGTVGRMGLWVEQVIPDSPADIGGIQPGDLIFLVNQTPIESRSRFRELVGDASPGSTLAVRVLRYSATTSGWEAKEFPLVSVPFGELSSP